VQVANGIMLVNYEIVSKEAAAAEGLAGGLGIYDVGNPYEPKAITRWTCDGTGVHRFTFDGRYAYISPEIEGYRGNIVMILDLAEPARPVEVGRWWMPGQWIAGGETPSWRDASTAAIMQSVTATGCMSATGTVAELFSTLVI
jgi:hypothetical protein